jgi:hypothetical protein
MNDITKARYYLKAKQSDMQHLTSFGLMLVTAERKYRDLKLSQVGNKQVVGTYDKQIVEAMVDVAVLRHLKKYNQLPKDLPQALQPNLTLEEKRAFALRWMSA